MSIKRSKTRSNAIKHGYRSGLEQTVLNSLKDRKCNAQYECFKIEWEDLKLQDIYTRLLITKWNNHRNERQVHCLKIARNILQYRSNTLDLTSDLYLVTSKAKIT
jgi:hypothetical protein